MKHKPSTEADMEGGTVTQSSGSRSSQVPLRILNKGPKYFRARVLLHNESAGLFGPRDHPHRRSAVEVLEETKSLYVKSDTVLDTRQKPVFRAPSPLQHADSVNNNQSVDREAGKDSFIDDDDVRLNGPTPPPVPPRPKAALLLHYNTTTNNNCRNPSQQHSIRTYTKQGCSRDSCRPHKAVGQQQRVGCTVDSCAGICVSEGSVSTTAVAGTAPGLQTLRQCPTTQCQCYHQCSTINGYSSKHKCAQYQCRSGPFCVDKHSNHHNKQQKGCVYHHIATTQDNFLNSSSLDAEKSDKFSNSLKDNTVASQPSSKVDIARSINMENRSNVGASGATSGLPPSGRKELGPQSVRVPPISSLAPAGKRDLPTISTEEWPPRRSEGPVDGVEHHSSHSSLVKLDDGTKGLPSVRKRHKKAISRSRSDLTKRYSNSSDLSELSARFSRNSADLEKFFNEMGLDRTVLDPMISSSAQFGHAQSTSSLNVFESMSSVGSPWETRSWCSDDSQQKVLHEPPPPRGLRTIEIEEQRPVGPMSVVERNARVIKWLCSMKKTNSIPTPTGTSPSSTPQQEAADDG